ncbi:MAG TPA: sialidase family protein, partial [Chthoniobacterales bacterium]|nr:sialidase family protein [Chthoniobacterales bacterium]
MKKNPASITARVTLGAVLLVSGISLLCLTPFTGSYAANAKQKTRSVVRQRSSGGVTPNLPNTGPQPPSGAVNASGSQTASWVGTTISPGGNQNTDTTCMDNSSVLGCETFTLTVNGTQADWAGKKVQVLLTWTSIANEYDIWIHKGSNAGPIVTSAFQGPALTNQVAYIDASNLTTDSAHPTTVFTVHVAYDTTPASATDPYSGSATPVSTTATSITAAPQDTGPKVGFENFEAPGTLVPASALSSGGVTVEYLGRGAGEPSVGANWVTGIINFQSDLQTEFVTFNDSCNLNGPKATWSDRRAPNSQFIDSDPIGFTDHTSGAANRVFAGSLTLLSPDTVKIAHSDDDGVTWTPDQSGGIASAVDHETIGGGPYHAPLINPVYPHAVYYASQDIAAALVSRSDDGGSTYGPSVQMYTINQCSGLHGHIKVAPDGTVYVPNRACGSSPILNGGDTAVVVSTDNGITWTVKPVGNGSVPSTPATDDPAVAVDASGTVYCLFALNGTNAAVGISNDQGSTWKNIFDVGAGLGLTNVAFPAAIGGDAGRAAVAFYASKGGAGDSSADNYTGVWHLYVAETFDGGDHWTTTDVTPALPMQRMGLLRGGGGPMDRNLLDFFDITVDQNGRVVVGYVNGCSGGDCSQAPVNPDGSTTVTGNTYSATATIARQSSGRRLSGTQPNPVSVPGMPFVTERRVGPVVHLAWNEADPGNNPPGSPANQTITNYQIFRGTTPGGENASPIATVGGTVNKFDDMTAVDSTVTYYYKVVATNSAGSSCGNNEIAAPFVGDTCSGMIVHRNLPSHPEAIGGSETGVPVGPTPTPTPTPTATPPIPAQYLIDYIAVAEPPSHPGKLLFQMKVTNLSTVPANSRWRMVWNSITSPDEQYYVG